jgi:hypothetical protein
MVAVKKYLHNAGFRVVQKVLSLREMDHWPQKTIDRREVFAAIWPHTTSTNQFLDKIMSDVRFILSGSLNSSSVSIYIFI